MCNSVGVIRTTGPMSCVSPGERYRSETITIFHMHLLNLQVVLTTIEPVIVELVEKRQAG